MKTGDIVLIPFPFAEFSNRKVRPAVVICETNDKYKDIVVSAISSVVPLQLSKNEIILIPSISNQLRKDSILKVDRIVTAKKEDIISVIGSLDVNDLETFKKIFKELID